MNLGKKFERRVGKENDEYVSKSNTDLLGEMMMIMMFNRPRFNENKQAKMRQ